MPVPFVDSTYAHPPTSLATGLNSSGSLPMTPLDHAPTAVATLSRSHQTVTTPPSMRAETLPLRVDLCRDTECYPYIASIVSASPAPKVSALPRPDVLYTAKRAPLKVTCSPDTDAVAYAVTTE